MIFLKSSFDSGKSRSSIDPELTVEVILATNSAIFVSLSLISFPITSDDCRRLRIILNFSRKVSWCNSLFASIDDLWQQNRVSKSAQSVLFLFNRFRQINLKKRLYENDFSFEMSKWIWIKLEFAHPKSFEYPLDHFFVVSLRWISKESLAIQSFLLFFSRASI